MRNVLLILHILGAAAWIGGGLYGWFSYSRLAKAGAGSGLRAVAGAADRYFGPAAVLTLLSGIALVWTQDAWGWSDTFVLVGIGVFVFSAAWQPLVASKVEERFLDAVDGQGDLVSASRSVNLTMAVDLAVLLVALWAMVVKLGA